MKFLFIRSIHNNPALDITIAESNPLFTHANEIPKGFSVEIEKGVNAIKNLKPSNQDIVRALLSSKSVIIVDDSPESKDAVKRILAEVADEAKVRDITKIKVGDTKPDDDGEKK